MSSPPNRKPVDAPKDDFKHNLAIKLSRALNTVNPNDLLAQRVTDLALQHDLEGFSKGIVVNASFSSVIDMLAAAKTFGKFKDSFLAELHAEILLHVRQEASGLAPKPVEGILVHDSEVLEPEPTREGGLMRKDTVCSDRNVFDDMLTDDFAAAYFPSTCESNRTSHTSGFSFGP